MRVAVVGLGFLGSKVAASLVEGGHRVTVYDRSEDALSDAPKGAVRAANIADAAVGQDAIILLLRTSGQVKQVVQVLVEHLASGEGSVGPAIVSCATVSIETAIEAEALCRSVGLTFVDAPVNGRPPNMTIFVGADEEAYHRVKPVLTELGSHLHHMGPSGAGTATKLIHQGMLFGTHLLLQESLALGSRKGLDRGALLRALQTSSAGSAAVDRVAAGFADDELRGASIDLIGKDLDLVASMAAGVELETDLLSRLQVIYDNARQGGGGGEHFSRILECPARKADPGTANPQTVVAELIDLVNDDRLDLLEKVLAEEFVWHGIDGHTRAGVDAYRQRLQSAKYDISIERMVVDADIAVARLCIRRGDGTGRVTHDIFRVEGGRIHEEWSGHA